jgi:2-aminoadipate transaminase
VTTEPRPISFARGAPHPDALNAPLVAKAAERALGKQPASILSYSPGNGYAPLREWLGAQHGVSADEVFVSSGSLQGFVFLLEALFTDGGLLGVEAPTYDRALLQAKLHGIEVLPIPVEPDGLSTDALAAACAAGQVPKMVYVIPNFQNPSGATISLAKRHALVALANQYGFWILEDDPYGRLRFEGEHLPSLYSLGGPKRVIFTSSFSKTLAPGLRVGYIVAPKAIVSQLVATANRTYISPSLLGQAAVHEICESGDLDTNIARVTELMRQRRDAMMAGVAAMPAGTVCHRPEGGFFLWLTLPEGMSANALEAAAGAAGVSYVVGSGCFVSGGERTLRLAYSGVSTDEITEGMARLATVFANG